MSYSLEEYGTIVLSVLNKYYLKLFRRYKGPLHSSIYGCLLIADLVAKRTGTKVSAQWSNDEIVHQVLVDLLNGNSPEETAELLRKARSLKRGVS